MECPTAGCPPALPSAVLPLSLKNRLWDFPSPAMRRTSAVTSTPSTDTREPEGHVPHGTRAPHK